MLALPADGKILHGDFLYAVNGKLFGADIFRDIAEAITRRKRRKAKDIISFDLLRGGEKMTVELQLEVLGSYSVHGTLQLPEDRPHRGQCRGLSRQIWRGCPGTSRIQLNADAMFLLAAGSPEYQGLVRRHVYNRIETTDLDTPIDPDGRAAQGGPWDLSADILLISEYYLATGDKAVLPYLRHKCDGLTSIQIKGLEDKGPWPEVQAWTDRRMASQLLRRCHIRHDAGYRCACGARLSPGQGGRCPIRLQ
jgi:hypothetical protein